MFDIPTRIDHPLSELEAVEKHLALFQQIAENFYKRPYFEPFALGYNCVREELDALLDEKRRIVQNWQPPRN